MHWLKRLNAELKTRRGNGFTASGVHPHAMQCNAMTIMGTGASLLCPHPINNNVPKNFPIYVITLLLPVPEISA